MKKNYFKILNKNDKDDTTYHFDKLNLEDWTSLLDDYFTGNLYLLNNIF